MKGCKKKLYNTVWLTPASGSCNTTFSTLYLLSKAVFLIQRQSWLVVTETEGLQNMEYLLSGLGQKMLQICFEEAILQTVLPLGWKCQSHLEPVWQVSLALVTLQGGSLFNFRTPPPSQSFCFRYTWILTWHEWDKHVYFSKFQCICDSA